MKIYSVKLEFINLDNSLFTDAQADMMVEIRADDEEHAYLLAERLKKVFDADYVFVE